MICCEVNAVEIIWAKLTQCVFLWQSFGMVVRRYGDTVDGQNPAPPGMVKTPINNGIIIILGGAGFCPSTVWPKLNVPRCIALDFCTNFAGRQRMKTDERSDGFECVEWGSVMCWLRKSMTRGEKRTVYIYICVCIFTVYTYWSQISVPFRRDSICLTLADIFSKQCHSEKSDYGSCPKQHVTEVRLVSDPRWRVTAHPESIQGGISQCRIFTTKMSARSQLTRRSESEEAEDADEDKCTAKSDIVPALTWDGIEGLYTLHCPRGMGCTACNLTKAFNPVSTVRESTRFPKIQVYQVSHVDVLQFLRRIELKLSEIRVESDETSGNLHENGSLWIPTYSAG